MKNRTVKKYLSCILAISMFVGEIQPSAAQEYDDTVMVEAESAEDETIENAVTEKSDTEVLEESDTAETEMQDFEINEISVYSDDAEGYVGTENYTDADSYGMNVLTEGEGTLTYPITETYGNITWSLDAEGTLTVSGTGKLEWIWGTISGGKQWSEGVSCVKKVVINDGITELGEDIFYKFVCLTSIEIPDSVSKIGENAFFSCSSLKSITIPKKVTSIEASTFYNCGELTSTVMPDNVTSIGNNAFDRCSKLESVTIPKKVTNIGNAAFRHCSELTSVVIPDGVTSIGTQTFLGCSKLNAISIPDSVTSIEKSAFWDCSSLKSITIPKGVTSIEPSTFYCCYELSSVVIPGGVTSIGGSAFGFCEKLSSINIPDSVTSIGENAFIYCSELTDITIPKGVTRIEPYTFNSCEKLSAIRIPKSVSAIGDEAFAWSGMQTVYGDAGSYAETYAQSNGYLFVDLSHAEDQIRNLPEPTELTLEKKSDVAAVKAEYDKLSDEAKKFVEAALVQKLTAAVTKIQELEAEVKSAEEIKEVNDVIAALPNGLQVTLENKNAIEAARKAYESLTQEQKQKISADVLQQLTAAETKIKELEAAAQHVHAYSTWKTVSKATVFAAEVQKRTCTCGASETRNCGKKLTAVLELPGKLKSLQIKKGNTKTFALTMANGDSVKSVKSSADKVLKATLDKNGKITLKAVKTGTAELTIKLTSSESRIYTVKVIGGTVKTTAVSVTNVANKKLTLAKGNTYSLKTTVKPFTSTQKLTYKSSNKKIATVTSSGKIKAVAPGKATITVKSGSKSVKITVTVPGITNVKSTVTVKKNKTLTLNPKFYGISGKVSYQTSNKKVATVNSKGKIKGIKKGTAKITVQAGSYSRTVTVKVK